MNISNSISEISVTPDQLLLDPNNFRFQDRENFTLASEQRFHEETVQNRAKTRLRNEDNIGVLKKSILTNGFLPVEKIVVRKYGDYTPAKYVVIEGNRRVCAIQWILEDNEAGVEIPQDVLTSVTTLKVLETTQEGSSEVFQASIMGIRHVSGITEWGGYQRAKLVSRMRDELELSSQEISDRLGMSTHEVNRRFRAFKALEQMKDDEEFGEYASPQMYAMFHEAVSLPDVKSWLSWDEESATFTDEENRTQFYSLICPSSDDDGNERPAKISGRSNVRDIRFILSKADAKRALLDPDKSFEEAVAIAKQEEFARAWASEVNSTIRALDAMGIAELKNLTDDDVELLQKLKQVAAERLNDHTTLSSNPA